jgi:hypothetical protein
MLSDFFPLRMLYLDRLQLLCGKLIRLLFQFRILEFSFKDRIGNTAAFTKRPFFYNLIINYPLNSISSKGINKSDTF